MAKQRIQNRDRKIELHNLPLAPEDVRVDIMTESKEFVTATGNYSSCSGAAIAAVAEFLAYHQGYRLR